MQKNNCLSSKRQAVSCNCRFSSKIYCVKHNDNRAVSKKIKKGNGKCKGYKGIRQTIKQYSYTTSKSTAQDHPKASREQPAEECSGCLKLENHAPLPMGLWKVEENVRIKQANVTIFNSDASTTYIEVEIEGDNVNYIRIYPGNTGTFTGKNIHQMSIVSAGSGWLYVEGRYSIAYTRSNGEKCEE